MPYKVNSCFDDFIKYEVNLKPERVKIARTSRNNLFDNIKQLCEDGRLPIHYFEKNISYGSFARRTKVRPLDDIDLMFCFSACGGHYVEVCPNTLYTIKMQDGLSIYDDLCDEQGNLNSRKMINYIIKNITSLKDYKKSEMHRNQEVATLQLRSYEWNFDIIPCFYAYDDFYLIPDGKGNWKKTDPRIDAQRIESVNSQVKLYPQSKDLYTFIRLMKYWKREKWGNHAGSYLFEQMVLNFVSANGICKDWQHNVSNCLLYLSGSILNGVEDPKGMQGNLNMLDIETRSKLSKIAFDDFNVSLAAIINEDVSNRMQITHATAINHWHSIFGNGFKQYGQSYE